MERGRNLKRRGGGEDRVVVVMAEIKGERERDRERERKRERETNREKIL